MGTLHADAHVHIYPCFDRAALLRAALARARALPGPLALFLCESSGCDAFSELRECAERGGPAPGGLRLRAPRERASLAASEADGAPEIFLIAGRQLVSSEGIEVLALGLEPGNPLGRVPDRARPAAELLEQALSAGALAVLPWGVGKWLGARGRRVAALASDPTLAANRRFFLGDIAQRCWPWPEPRLFERHRVLCGSDPLPVPGAEARVARYGVRVEGTLSPDEPTRSLRAALEGARAPERFGRRESLRETLREQLAYRRRRGALSTPEASSCATT